MIQAVKHGGTIFRVDCKPNVVDPRDNESLHGQILYSQRLIEVCSLDDDCKQAETTLHETLHLLMHKAGHPFDEEEERLVRLISRGLLDIGIQTPGFFEWFANECAKVRHSNSCTDLGRDSVHKGATD